MIAPFVLLLCCDDMAVCKGEKWVVLLTSLLIIGESSEISTRGGNVSRSKAKALD